MRRTQVTVDGRRLSLSNLEKVMYPATGTTKGAVLDYYARVSRVLLPHLQGRELTLKRWPDGVAGPHFWEKRCPGHRPEWVRTAEVRSAGGGSRTVCVVDDLPALMWAVNLASLELHVSLHRVGRVTRPLAMVFDLDPGPPAGLLGCARVALRLKALLDDLSLASVIKTSGSKGLHVFVPLDGSADYDRTCAVARGLAEVLARRHPDEVVARMRRDLRPGKVYVDWAQNERHKTTAVAWSLRATERPQASTPLRWEELERAVAAGDGAALVFGPDEALARAAHGDPFEPATRSRQRLPEALGAREAGRHPRR